MWGFDVTHFTRCRRAPNCFAIVDLVSRKWISTLLSPEETANQTKVLFLTALEAEGLIEAVEDRLDTGELPDPDGLPILLAVSDNGAPMTADATRAFMALCSIAQHFGRPGVRPPTRLPSRASSATSRPTGRTWRRSPIPTSWPPSWSGSGWSTTRCAFLMGSRRRCMTWHRRPK